MNTLSTAQACRDEVESYWVGNTEFATIKVAGDEADGAYALVEFTALPGAGPTPHIHHTFGEVYYLLEGELEFLNGEQRFTAKAGSTIHIPKGSLHAWRNTTSEPVRGLNFISPAGFEQVILQAGTPATDISTPPPPLTDEEGEQLLELASSYDTEYVSVQNW